MIHDLLEVRFGAALEKQSRHRRVVSDACGAVQRGLPPGLRIVVVLPEPRIRVCAAVEQRRRGAHEAIRPGLVLRQVRRETEVGERIDVKWGAPGLRARGIAREESAHRAIVAKDCRGVDIACRDLGMLGEDRVGARHRPVPERRSNEGRSEIALIAHGARSRTITAIPLLPCHAIPSDESPYRDRRRERS